MERYRPIHPERPAVRAAVAVALSLAVHGAALALLVAWALATLAAVRKAEAERPKEVALAELDAERWAANRRLAAPEVDLGQSRLPPLPDARSVARGTAGQPPAGGRDDTLLPGDSPEGWAAEEGPDAPAPVLGPGAAPAGPTLDLRPPPRALAMLPLDMVFAPPGDGGMPDGQGTSFLNLTVAHPEAWRFAVFYNRAVENMDSVWRHEMGAPVSAALWKDMASRRSSGACSYTWVRIERGGRVVEARVRLSSGYPDMDEVLAETIRRTSPYVNLPQGLYDAGGTYVDTWRLCIGFRY